MYHDKIFSTRNRLINLIQTKVENGDSETLLNKVEKFIESNEDSEKYLSPCSNYIFDIPLMAACEVNDIDVVRFLLNKGAKLESNYGIGRELGM